MLCKERSLTMMMSNPDKNYIRSITQKLDDTRSKIYWDEGGVFSSFPSVESDLDVATDVNARARSCGFDLV